MRVCIKHCARGAIRQRNAKAAIYNVSASMPTCNVCLRAMYGLCLCLHAMVLMGLRYVGIVARYG